MNNSIGKRSLTRWGMGISMNGSLRSIVHNML